MTYYTIINYYSYNNAHIIVLNDASGGEDDALKRGRLL